MLSNVDGSQLEEFASPGAGVELKADQGVDLAAQERSSGINVLDGDRLDGIRLKGAGLTLAEGRHGLELVRDPHRHEFVCRRPFEDSTRRRRFGPNSLADVVP